MADQSENITGPGGIDPSKSVQPGEEGQSKPGQSFQSYMEGQGPQGPGAKTEGPTPFDLAAQGKQLQGATTPTHETVMSQMNSASSVLGDLQNQLSNNDLKLRQSQKYLLRNKLNSANQNIRTAAKKTGVDAGPPPPQTSKQSPLSRFLGLVTDSQAQLQGAQSKIQEMNTNGQSMNPGEILLIQTKLSKAQQELEYSSVLLSTATSDIKTLFNIQL